MVLRAYRGEHYAIAGGLPENAFIDAPFRVGAGRGEADRKRARAAIFAAATKELSTLVESPRFALSLEIREVDPVLSWKAIHPPLRHGAPARASAGG